MRSTRSTTVHMLIVRLCASLTIVATSGAIVSCGTPPETSAQENSAQTSAKLNGGDTSNVTASNALPERATVRVTVPTPAGPGASASCTGTVIQLT